MSLFQRSVSRIVDVRKEETSTALLMFAYAYLAMTAYNIIQPLTRSKLIASLGAVNVPWVIFGSGLFIGVLMLGYTRVVSMLPRALGAADHASRHGGDDGRVLGPLPHAPATGCRWRSMSGAASSASC